MIAAVWFGLVTGLVEGTLFLVLRQLGRLTFVSFDILWFAPLFNLLLFGVLGLFLSAAGRLFPQFRLNSVAVYLFSFLALLNWLMLILGPHIEWYAILILAAGLAAVAFRAFNKYQRMMIRFWRRSVAWLAVLTLLALFSIQGGQWLHERVAVASLPTTPPTAPNVLLIVVDTLRADHLATYGYPEATSPTMDQIAQQGVLFESAIAPSSNSLPSHVSLFTGRNLSEHGAEWSTPKALLDSPHPTLAEVLRAQGYCTAAFSANLFWITREEGFGRGFIHFEDYFHSLADGVWRTVFGRAFETLVMQRLGFDDIPARRRAADINQAVLEWLERHPEKPFFVFVNYMDTHDPYLPPQPYRGMFADSSEPGGILNCHAERCDPKLTPEQLQAEIDAYDGAIRYVDDQIGELLAEMQKRGFSNNALVVITSDHGEEFAEHGMYLHDSSLYRELIQVPLILWAPGRVPAGIRVAYPVTIASLPSTVLDLLGLGDASPFPGPSLALHWTAADVVSDWPYPMAEIEQRPWEPERSPAHHGSIKSLVSPLWHYIEHETLGTELYEWSQDPSESHNLAESPDLQDTVRQLRVSLDKILAQHQGSSQEEDQP